MKKKQMLEALNLILKSWEQCDIEIKEKSKLFVESWIIPNVEICIKELKR